GREADLALRHAEPGDAVHHEDDVAAGIAEPLGDPGRGERGPQAHERGAVRCRDNDNRTGQTFGAEVVLDELAYLSPAFTDEGDHRHVGLGAAGDHREQARLSDSRTSEHAEALPAAARDEGVKGPYAEGHGLIDQ